MNELLRIVEGFGAPFGFERSVKLVEGALLADRCLMSLHRQALGRDPARALVEALDPPAPLQAKLEVALEGADVVHFGHEAEPGARVRKLYFEYAQRARAAMARGEATLVHLAYKWRPGAASFVETRYVWRPCASRAQAAARIERRLTEPRGRALALALLVRTADLADRGELPMLDVEEPGNPRRSLDINVYDAGLTLGGIGWLIEEAVSAFGVSRPDAAKAFGALRDKPLGHLAAGVDRAGREFVTFYFGVEERRP